MNPVPVPTPPPLRTSVVMDYQNVHLVGHDVFPSARPLLRHETLVDPLLFSTQLIKARNLAMQAGYPRASSVTCGFIGACPPASMTPMTMPGAWRSSSIGRETDESMSSCGLFAIAWSGMQRVAPFLT